jgi:hypothetical protein
MSARNPPLGSTRVSPATRARFSRQTGHPSDSLRLRAQLLRLADELAGSAPGEFDERFRPWLRRLACFARAERCGLWELSIGSDAVICR